MDGPFTSKRTEPDHHAACLSAQSRAADSPLRTGRQMALKAAGQCLAAREHFISAREDHAQCIARARELAYCATRGPLRLQVHFRGSRCRIRASSMYLFESWPDNARGRAVGPSRSLSKPAKASGPPRSQASPVDASMDTSPSPIILPRLAAELLLRALPLRDSPRVRVFFLLHPERVRERLHRSRVYNQNCARGRRLPASQSLLIFAFSSKLAQSRQKCSGPLQQSSGLPRGSSAQLSHFHMPDLAAHLHY